MNHYGEEVGIKSFRKHLGWYSKSLENSNEFRCKINNCLDKSKIKSLIKDFFLINMKNENDYDYLRDFFDLIPDPIVIINKKTFKIYFVNQEFQYFLQKKVFH